MDQRLFFQYVADNVNCSIRTLDGGETLHGIGNNLTIAPKTRGNIAIERIKVSWKEKG